MNNISGTWAQSKPGCHILVLKQALKIFMSIKT
jgi:hypothetical protein